MNAPTWRDLDAYFRESWPYKQYRCASCMNVYWHLQPKRLLKRNPMIHLIMALRDSKAESFSQPMLYTAKGAALRAFQDAVNDSAHELGKHPEDYSLFFLGSYNDNTGMITPNVDGPIVLVNGATSSPPR